MPSAGWRQRALEVCTALGLDPARVARRTALVGGLLAVAVVAVVALRGTGGSPPEIHLPRAGAPSDPGATATTTPTDGPTYAHAAGAVARPGVYRVPPGARVADLLDAAGGPVADADVDQLNLAAPVADGERVYVPRRGEAAAVVPPPAAARGAGAPTGPVNLNTATLEQLDALPGVGPATAQAILDYRTEHGRFRSVEELLEVRGIGEAKLADLRPRVRV